MPHQGLRPINQSSSDVAESHFEHVVEPDLELDLQLAQGLADRSIRPDLIKSDEPRTRATSAPRFESLSHIMWGVSMPHIPGFLGAPLMSKSLADLWQRPSGDFPDVLWPRKALEEITRNPDGWIAVSAHHSIPGDSHGIRCILVLEGDGSKALTRTSWIGRELGSAWGTPSETFYDGLRDVDADASIEFFAQVRHPSGSENGVVDISHPFLWFWDAFPVADGWNYVDEAGRDHELVRYELDSDHWIVRVRVLEFRMFLASSGRAAVLQIDHTSMVAHAEFDRVDDFFENEWAHFEYCARYMRSLPKHPAVSSVMGQYLLAGAVTSKTPRFSELRESEEHPKFIYAIDSATGRNQTHTCDPDELGTYFDEDNSRVHYLTPIYFKRAVLQPYVAEPSRYRVSSSRLECLDLWGVDISFNSVGLVEVYLGDLGEKIPDSEWGHWKSYNVPPEGEMDEGRYRRDFLGQWASSKDVPGDLKRARDAAASVSESALGKPLWRPVTGVLKGEFGSLMGPLTEDPSALNSALLVLTKVLVDSIDPSPLKALANGEKNIQSLALLKRYLESLGDVEDTSEIFRLLQAYRSRGGVAHLANSDSRKAAANLGIDGLSNLSAFEFVADRLTRALSGITKLIEDQLAKDEDEAAGVPGASEPRIVKVDLAGDCEGGGVGCRQGLVDD